ncbi:unnamed protein product [Camellia sinensis]
MYYTLLKQLTGPPILHPPNTAGKLLPANTTGKTPPDSSQKPLNNVLLHLNLNGLPENLTSWLKHAWSSNPLTTLKLICHLCSCPNKEWFYAAVIWLHQNHPLTLAFNIRIFSGFGCLRDFLVILDRSLVDPEEQTRSVTKKEREITRARRVVDKYRCDSNYRRLHDRVSDLFAESLKSDLEFLKSGDVERIGLASKHCPSIDSTFDKSTLICEGIARRIFPRESDSVYVEIKEAHYAYRVRERLRKEVLVPLRKALATREKDSISDPQSARTRRTSTFRKVIAKGVDKRFRFYAMIAAKYANKSDESLFAHQFTSAFDPNTCSETADTQRRRLVEDLLKTENLKNSIAICDASGKAAIMNIGLAMSLLISELSDGPWKGKVFTFNDRPKLRKIEGDNPHAKAQYIKQLAFSNNDNHKVDFCKVFDRILQVLMNGKMSKDKMVKRVFMFSENEFCKVAKNYEKENYKEVWENYRKRGHKTVPEVVFFNLRNTVNCCVMIVTPTGMKSAEIMISGFLKRLINLFLKREGVENLDVVMKSLPKQEDLITLTGLGERYKDVDLLVFD